MLRFAQDPSLPTTPSDTDTRGVHPTERAQRSCAEGRVRLPPQTAEHQRDFRVVRIMAIHLHVHV